MTESPQDAKPHWKRSLDEFSDETITLSRQRKDGWTAVLDCGFRTSVSDPDFPAYGATREQAIERCAGTIRADAKGIGKFAPHAILVDSHELHFRLAPHWAMKERIAAAGGDPHEFVHECSRAADNRIWKIDGGWLYVNSTSMRMEADFRMQLLDLDKAAARGEDIDEKVAKLRQEFGGNLLKATHDVYDTRMAEHVATLTVSRGLVG